MEIISEPEAMSDLGTAAEDTSWTMVQELWRGWCVNCQCCGWIETRV